MRCGEIRRPCEVGVASDHRVRHYVINRAFRRFLGFCLMRWQFRTAIPKGRANLVLRRRFAENERFAGSPNFRPAAHPRPDAMWCWTRSIWSSAADRRTPTRRWYSSTEGRTFAFFRLPGGPNQFAPLFPPSSVPHPQSPSPGTWVQCVVPGGKIITRPNNANCRGLSRR